MVCNTLSFIERTVHGRRRSQSLPALVSLPSWGQSIVAIGTSIIAISFNISPVPTSGSSKRPRERSPYPPSSPHDVTYVETEARNNANLFAWFQATDTEFEVILGEALPNNEDIYGAYTLLLIWLRMNKDGPLVYSDDTQDHNDNNTTDIASDTKDNSSTSTSVDTILV
ncbi:hypothetical protein H101_08040 [Trichophyton interdigitale H6]|nr:hypothetical protein H101_08040 [Trichophyton interdigitale H6]